MKIKPTFLLQLSLIAILLSACNGVIPTPTPTPVPTPTPTPQPTTAASSISYHFVTSKLTIPTTQAQSDSLGLNIDGDPQNQADNLFGNLLTLINSTISDLEMQSTIDQAISNGEIVTLHSFKTNDPLNTSSATWSVLLGQTSQGAPRFDGTDQFTLYPGAPTNTQITGTLTNGHFAGGPGEVRAQIMMLGSRIDVGLIGVRVEADVNEKGCTNGKLGGGIAVSEFRSTVLPALATGLNQVVSANPDMANNIMSIFDTDQNGSITADELENNFIIKLATTPDIDLLDATGKFNPRQDGVKDSMSIGMGFTCAPAVFTEPEK